jgi:hypothetical protein
MPNLYWKHEASTKNIPVKDFPSERDFEEYVFKNQDLLGDIIIIYRQIRSGTRQGIPDMLGVDPDGNICLIEMKNVQVSEDVLPQVLSYAVWAETNPDSIKAIWLEAKNKPEDINIDWDSIQIRIIIIAPSFNPNVLRMSSKINYAVDLIQIQRFSDDQDEFILVEALEDTSYKKVGITKPMGDWSWEYYEENHGKEATAEFKKTVDALAAFVKEQKWNLTYNLNKYYTGFKLGNKIVFSVNWDSALKWSLRLKIPEEVSKNYKGQKWAYQRYDKSFNDTIFRTLSGNYENIDELKDLLILAYKHVSGIEK